VDLEQKRIEITPPPGLIEETVWTKPFLNRLYDRL
jgi:hypothetical protein